MKSWLIETLGWLGMSCVLLAYGLVSFSVWTPAQPAYHLLNIVGSAGIVIVAFRKKDWQPELLNIIWILIALISLLRLL